MDGAIALGQPLGCTGAKLTTTAAVEMFNYAPLFLGFPENVLEDDAYFAKRIVGYLGNSYELFDDGADSYCPLKNTSQ